MAKHVAGSAASPPPPLYSPPPPPPPPQSPSPPPLSPSPPTPMEAAPAFPPPPASPPLPPPPSFVASPPSPSPSRGHVAVAMPPPPFPSMPPLPSSEHLAQLLTSSGSSATEQASTTRSQRRQSGAALTDLARAVSEGLHRSVVSAVALGVSGGDGTSSSFSSPLPPCPEDPPAPPPPSCTPPQYQPLDENDGDNTECDEDEDAEQNRDQRLRSGDSNEGDGHVAADHQAARRRHRVDHILDASDDRSADADTEDMDDDVREEQESVLPTPPPPPSPPAAAPLGTPPPPPPPYSPPTGKSLSLADASRILLKGSADSSEAKQAVVDERKSSTTATAAKPISSSSVIASMRTAATNREIMAGDSLRDASPDRPRWYIGDIDHYTIIDKVGSGTYGEVFKCQHKVTKDIVALKKLRSDVEKNGFPVTSIREMKILKQLRHPNIMLLKEIVSSKAPTKEGKRPPLYFALEYLEHDLSGLLNHPRVKFSRTQIQCYMRQLLCGVAFMHRNKIIHRDIKASNLLLNNQGMLKITDFGLSRFWNEVNAKAGRYTNKVVTLWYRSPELLLGSTSYDFSVDVWSVGLIFAELLLGRPLLQGKTEIEQLQLIFGLVGLPNEDTWPDFKKLPGAKDIVLDEKYVCPLRDRFKSFPPHVIDLLEKLLTLDPAQRITAAEAMDHDYFWRVMTCKPRDLPKFGVSSTHEYQSKKRHHGEAAAAAAASQQNGDHNRRVRHRGEHYRGHYQGKGASAHGASSHNASNRGDRGRGYRHRDSGGYFDRDRAPERPRDRDRSRERDVHRPDHERDRQREREQSDRYYHRVRHEDSHARRRGSDGQPNAMP